MRTYGAARVLVGIYQRSERDRRLNRGIEPKPYLPEEGEIGAKTGRDHQFINHYATPAAGECGGDPEPAVDLRDGGDGKSGFDLNLAGSDEGSEVRA